MQGFQFSPARLLLLLKQLILQKISPDPDLCSQKGSNESIYEIMFDNRILNHRNWILKAFSHFSRKNHRIIDYLNLDTVILSFILITSHLFHLSQSIHFSVGAFPISRNMLLVLLPLFFRHIYANPGFFFRRYDQDIRKHVLNHSFHFTWKYVFRCAICFR